MCHGKLGGAVSAPVAREQREHTQSALAILRVRARRVGYDSDPGAACRVSCGGGGSGAAMESYREMGEPGEDTVLTPGGSGGSPVSVKPVCLTNGHRWVLGRCQVQGHRSEALQVYQLMVHT